MNRLKDKSLNNYIVIKIAQIEFLLLYISVEITISYYITVNICRYLRMAFK